MRSDDPRLMRLAAAVADGTPVDWPRALESTPDPELRQVVQQLQVVAGLASVHWTSGDPGTEDETAQPIPVPDSWGPLKLRRRIGRGTFGTVYLAWDPNLEREVALKILQPLPRSDAVMQEGRLLARVRHPNVVTVYGVDQFDGALGLWMEFVDGVTLKQLLQERGAFGAHETALIGIDVCRAVAAVHQAGLLHRDIKSQNVMREAGGRIVLMDFGAGAAQTERARPGRRLTGTPLYLAPEVLGGQPATIASDIYSVGILLYHLLTKRYPVEGDTVSDLEAAHARRQTTPLSDLRPDLPAGIGRVIERALDPDPARRHRSAGAMQQELLNTIAPDGIREAVVADPGAISERTRHLPWSADEAVRVPIAIGVAFVAWYVAHPDRPFVLGSPRQLTTAPGWEAEPALGPDSNLVAYTSDQSGNPDIWLVDMLTGASLQLTDDPAPDRSPSWLPDGSAILFVSSRGGKTAIWKTPRLGGPAVLVVENAEDPAVAPDGSKLAFARRDANGQFRINVAPLADASNARVLTTASSGLYDHRQPAWSPDSRRIVYHGLRDLWIVSATDSKVLRLTADDAADRDPVWSPDGRFVYFSSDRGGTHVLWRVPSTGGRAVRLTGGQGPEGYPSLSADGSRLVYSTYDRNPDLVLRDLGSGREERLGSDRMETNPIFSPDGESLVFVSNRWAGRFDLWSQRLAGGTPAGEPRRLTDQPGSASAPAYSPDGRWIAYYRVIQGQRDVWIISASGGSPIQFTNDPAVDAHPDWAPDGRQLVFLSDRDGSYQIWTQPIRDGRPAGAARRVTSGPPVIGAPTWSPSGAEVAYVGGDSEIWLADPDGHRHARKVTIGAGALRVAWNHASGDLWVNGYWGADAPSIRLVDVKTGESRSATPPITLSRTTVPDFDLSWDGRRIAFAREVLRGDLWVQEARAKTF